MAADDDRVLISYDPATGKLEFSSPKDQLDKASSTAQLLIKTAHACLLSQEHRESKEESQSDPKTEAPKGVASPVAKPPRKAGGSSGRSGRIGSFEKQDLGLNEDQERAIHEFYSSRRPAEQKLQVVIAMYIGEKVLKRQAFDYNEIYTLMHLGGERVLPKALDVVIGELAKDNWVVKDGKAYALKFLARDYVEKLSVEAA